jgi:hypothetical protein
MLIKLEKLLERISKFLPREGLGYYELKKLKPWFDEEYSELLDQIRPSQIAVVTGSKRSKWG